MKRNYSSVLYIIVLFVLFPLAVFLLSQSGNYYNNYVYAQSSSPTPASTPTPTPTPSSCSGFCTVDCVGPCDHGQYCYAYSGQACLSCPACNTALFSPYDASRCVPDPYLAGSSCVNSSGVSGVCQSGTCVAPTPSSSPTTSPTSTISPSPTITPTPTPIQWLCCPGGICTTTAGAGCVSVGNYCDFTNCPSPTPTPTPTPTPGAKCHNKDNAYNPIKEACCGNPNSDLSVVYTTATEKCCSSSSNGVGIKYNKTTEACCGDPNTEGIIVYAKNSDEGCCTSSGYDGPNSNSAGLSPRLFSPQKRETCCPTTASAPNICDGCQKCVDVDKTYVNVFAPDCEPFSERICNGRIEEKKGQCVNNCLDCTSCSDASKATDGTEPGTTFDRRPKINGEIQTEGLFCQNIKEILTDEHYKNSPGDEKPPNDAKTTFICSCASYTGNGCGWGENNIDMGRCYQYDKTGYGYPPQPRFGDDNGCPLSSGIPAKIKGTCRCSGASRCSSGEKDRYGNSIYVCAEVGKECEDMVVNTGIEGRAELHYEYSDHQGLNFTYDCGTKDCCQLDEIVTNYCGGPMGMFCIHGVLPEKGGRWCDSTAGGAFPCRKSDDDDGGGGGGDGPPGTGCDDTGACVSGGAGDGCDISDPNACASQASCGVGNDYGKCIIGGGHGVCSTDEDCIVGMYCTNDLKCSSEGTGIECTSDSDCEDQPTCTVDGKCEIGGEHGVCPSVDSVGDDFCAKVDTKCNAKKQCTSDGKGKDCDLENGNADCEDQPGCNSDKECVAGGTLGVCPSADFIGDFYCEPEAIPKFCNDSLQCTEEPGEIYCETDADCQPLSCNSNRQCVPYGGVKPCTIYTLNESNECQDPLECDNVAKRCVPDGGGIACINDVQCGGNEPPTASNLEVEPFYCLGSARFSWIYSDAEPDPYVKYQLQMSTINDDPSTQTDEFETGLVFNTGEAQAAPENILVPVYLVTQRSPTSCISSQPCNGFINYGVSYYWRVKVWEQQPGGLQVSSQWAYYKDTHTFDPPNNYNEDEYPDYADDKDKDVDTYKYPYEHPQPLVRYEPPSTVLPNQPAAFTDSSVCYHYDTEDESTISYFCKDLIPPGSSQDDCKVPGGVCYECTAATDLNGDGRKDCYAWWHNGYSNDDLSSPSPTSYIIGNTQYTYSSPRSASDPYQTKLQICDDIMCCSGFRPVVVSPSSGSVVPQWWEITPYNQ